MNQKLLKEIERVKEVMSIVEKDSSLKGSSLIITESVGGVVQAIRRIALNAKFMIDDIISKYGDDVGDAVRRLSDAETVEEQISALNSLKNINEELALEFRVTFLSRLGAQEKAALNEIIEIVELNLNSGQIDDLSKIERYIEESIDAAFEELPAGAKETLKDCVLDQSPSIKNALDDVPSPNRPRVPNQTRTLKTFEEMFPSAEELSELQTLINQHYKTKGNAPEWMKNWVGRGLLDSRSEVQRVLSNKDAFVGIENRLRKMTVEDLETFIGKKIADSNARVMEMAKDKSFMARLKRASSKLPEKFKTPDTLKGWLHLAGMAFLWTTGIGGLIIGAISLLGDLGKVKFSQFKEWLTKNVETQETVDRGGVNKLNDENESKIYQVLKQLKPEIFDESSGTLKNGYMIEYNPDGKSLIIINDEGDTEATYDLETINSKLTSQE